VLPNIVLIGFMGSGKSSVGRRLASLTGHRFLDTDELIVKREGVPISRIFRQHGEDYFRRVEAEEVAALVGIAGVILATGGGVILSETNRRHLHELGAVAWLDADPEVLFERVSRNKKRPLLQTESPRESFDALRGSRLGIYEETADFRIDSSGLGHDEVARQVLEEVMRWSARRIRD